MEKYLQCKNPKRVRDLFVEEAKSFAPDLIHLQIQHTNIIDDNSINKIKGILPNVIITNWTGDVRNNVPSTYHKIAQVSDYNFISSTGQLEMFKSVMGRDVKYWQIGFNPKLYSPPKNKLPFDYDAVFIGNFTSKDGFPGTKTRVAACELLRERFGDRFLLGGHGWNKSLRSKGSIDQRTLSSYYHKSVCLVSVSHYNELDHYFSDRLLISMASGRPTVSLKFPKYESYFTNMCDLVMVDDVREIPDAVMMLKNNTELADYIGESGAAKVFAEHTYYSRVKELLNVLGLL